MTTNDIGLSCCSISSIPLDYEENKLKIIESIKKCKQLNCSVRIGGELELCGVSCKGSFREIEDMHEKCWLCLSEILREKYNNKHVTDNILCFISMPVYFRKKLYNCELFIYNNEIILISPKENVYNCNQRDYFASYLDYPEEEKQDEQHNSNDNINTYEINFKNSNVSILGSKIEKFALPKCIQNVTNQTETYIGKALICFGQLVIAHVFLDDLVVKENAPSIVDRVDMFNASGGSHGSVGCISDIDCIANDASIGNVGSDAKKVSFQNDCVKLYMNNRIKFECIDVLLVSGYITNELLLFRKYFTELMNLTKQYPNMALSFSNNFGCDNYFFKFDGFSFIIRNGKLLTKNARFSFSDIQVSSINVSFNKEKKNWQQNEQKQLLQSDLMTVGGETFPIMIIEELEGDERYRNINRDNCQKCIFSFNKEIDLHIRTSEDNLVNFLPSNFNWQIYAQGNDYLVSLFKNHHNSLDNYMYEFDSKMYALHNIYEELSFNCALFLWYILHLTNAKGFILALSGGIDSSFCACMVHILSIMIEIRLKEGSSIRDSGSGSDNRNDLDIQNEELFTKKTKNLLIDKACRRDICNKLLNTLSLPSKYSSENTKFFAEQLSKSINSYHNVYCIDNMYTFLKNVGEDFLKKDMKYKSEGGSNYEDVCLQNIQSRSRLLVTYFFSSLICHKKYYSNNLHNEYLIVLATGNLDESITGYYTKYDCSSGDIDIIGNVSKLLIKETMCHLGNDSFYDLKILNKINEYHPSAELKPLENKQTDEEDLNLKYMEIKLLTILKNKFFFGPSSMFYYLSNYFWSSMSQAEIFNKIKTFFTRMFKNTHKLFILPPALTNESCGLHLCSVVNFAKIDFELLRRRLSG
ncbi:glutamine-dependent NAD synthetase [Plasmodium brasilianum]|uniref:Glutamine-dependent NAD synthetase n=1 Tax=Plasmodium brasilianum TaxID=5824 RepID=A0ACB9YCT1_PLABR|nr:glutamine-dependent NAD synthetase [Plasmodium brasilianum]